MLFIMEFDIFTIVRFELFYSFDGGIITIKWTQNMKTFEWLLYHIGATLCSDTK